jgi:WhiB family redox-sensing transcriptional regulator
MDLNVEWRKAALCAQVDPEIFFPEIGSSYGSQQAKKLCGSCDVKQQCLDYALENRERYGVWGGASPGDRYRMLRRSNPRFRWPSDHAITNPFTPARGGPWAADATHCFRGHELNDENLHISAKGERRCRPCKRLHDEGRKKPSRKKLDVERTA